MKDYIFGNRAIIITARNIENINHSKITKVLEKGILVYDRFFGLHQDCFDSFADELDYECARPDYLAHNGNIIIYIIGPSDGKYTIAGYWPEKINEIQLAGLKEVVNSLDESIIKGFNIYKYEESNFVDYEYESDYINNITNDLINVYEEKLKSKNL